MGKDRRFKPDITSDGQRKAKAKNKYRRGNDDGHLYEFSKDEPDFTDLSNYYSKQ
jgi:hypothetical protein